MADDPDEQYNAWERTREVDLLTKTDDVGRLRKKLLYAADHWDQERIAYIDPPDLATFAKYGRRAK